jgi:hypothetical protein
MTSGLGPRQSKAALSLNTTVEGRRMLNVKSMVIGALAVGVAVLGYAYYQSQSKVVQITLPSVKVQ